MNSTNLLFSIVVGGGLTFAGGLLIGLLERLLEDGERKHAAAWVVGTGLAVFLAASKVFIWFRISTFDLIPELLAYVVICAVCAMAGCAIVCLRFPSRSPKAN